MEKPVVPGLLRCWLHLKKFSGFLLAAYAGFRAEKGDDKYSACVTDPRVQRSCACLTKQSVIQQLLLARIHDYGIATP
jgi:hypothetical protein